MKKPLIVLWCTFFCQFCNSQSLSRSVISSSGDSFHASSGSLDWTLGEVMTESYALSGKMLTQGFQQPEEKKIDVSLTISIYPNPVLDSMNIKINQIGNYRVEIYNLLGKKVIDQNSVLTSDKLPMKMNLHDLGPALYVLRIYSLKTGKSFSFKIEKI